MSAVQYHPLRVWKQIDEHQLALPGNKSESRALMSVIRVILKSIDFTSKWSGWLVSFFIYVMFTIITYEVFARYVFNAPTIWVHQISAYLFGSYVVLAGAYVFMHNEHVSMSLVHDRLSLRGRATVDCITFFVFFLFIALIVWQGGDSAYRATLIHERAQLHWDMCPIYHFLWTLPIGAALMGLAGINKFIRDFYVVIKGKEID